MGDVVCATGKCCKATCCAALPPPCTTITTTPAPTCESFTCPSGMDSLPGTTVCATGHCCAHTCCGATTVTTTPATTVTTTPLLTCAGFTCPSGTQNNGAVCANGHCCKSTCCTVVVTTPVNPCATVGRKYDSKEAELVQQAATPKKETGVAWAFPLFGVVAMFTLAAFFAVRVRQGRRSTRQMQMVQPVLQSEASANEADDLLIE